MNGDEDPEIPPLAERRPVARKKVLFGGVAVGRRKAANCQVRDISDKGARITVSRRTPLPEQLHLIIIRDRLAYEARVVWRRGDEAGLAFSKAVDLRAPSDPALADLAEICARKETDLLSWR